jgi:putative ABC transport system permease protein
LNSEKIEFQLRRTESAYWNIVDVEFVEGAPFTSKDDLDRNFVAVINEAMREKFFKGASALGKEISFDGRAYRVVGVVKNVPETRKVAFADIWAPIGTDKQQVRKAAITSNAELMGEYECVVLARSKQDLDAIRDAIKQAVSEVEFPDPKAFNLMETMAHNYFSLLANSVFFDWENHYSLDQSPKLFTMILSCALFFMLLPSINLMNLNVSRMMERASEIGVRKFFGASAESLVLQFLVENLVLTIVGAFIGLIFSVVLLKYLNESGLWAYSNFSFNWRVFLYGFLLMIVFGILSGVYPAWRMSKLNPIFALKGAAK